MADPKPVADQDVFSLTALGRAQLHDSSTSLARESLQLLVLVDGRATVAQVMRSAPGMSPEAVRAALAGLVADGLISAGDSGHPFGAIDPGDFFTVTAAAKAGGGLREGEFEQGVSSLKDSGYFVSIARRAETARSRASGARPVAVVVEDDPDLGKLLKTYLKLEGI